VATALAPSPEVATAEVVVALVLLSEFAMLRVSLQRSQVRLYAFQSLAVAALATVAAITRHEPDLYALAALSVALKAVAVPAIILRVLREVDVDLAGSHRLGVATMALIAAVVATFGFVAVGTLPFHAPSFPVPALGMAGAAILVAFLLVVLRRDVVSQAVGFFSLENGVSAAGLVVAAGLPLIVEVALLFDLLVAVVAFGVLMRVHHGRARTLSTETLDRLRG
jgi:hydrogenase-4 component E